MLRLFFGFQGRINRLQFFALTAANGVLLVIASLVVVLMNVRQMAAHDLSSLWLFAPVMILSIWVWLAITYKRMADIGIAKSLRRLMYVGVAIVGGVTNIAIGHNNPMLVLAIRSTPLLVMMFWPGRGEEGKDIDLAVFDAEPEPALASTASPFPAAAAPAPAAGAAPALARAFSATPPWPAPSPAMGGAPVFGRRGR